MSILLEGPRPQFKHSTIIRRPHEEGDMDASESPEITSASFQGGAFDEIKNIYQRLGEGKTPSALEVEFLAECVTEASFFLTSTLSDHGHVTLPPEWRDNPDDPTVHEAYQRLTTSYDFLVPEILQSQRDLQRMTANSFPYALKRPFSVVPIDTQRFFQPDTAQNVWRQTLTYEGPIDGVTTAELLAHPEFHIPLAEHAANQIAFINLVLEANNNSLPLDENSASSLEAITVAYERLVVKQAKRKSRAKPVGRIAASSPLVGSHQPRVTRHYNDANIRYGKPARPPKGDISRGLMIHRWDESTNS